MSELKKIAAMSDAQLRALHTSVLGSMRESLRLMALASTSKYMVRTQGPRSKGKLPLNTIAANPTTLTQRTGELARALTHTDHPQNVQFVREDGLSAELGLKSEYARKYGIHETGGTIPSHQIPITEKMRRFFLAKWLESDKQDGMWLAMTSKKKKSVTIPDVQMPKRAFLEPVTRDADVKQDIGNIFAKRVPESMREAMRVALS
jgi:hypothetical protein